MSLQKKSYISCMILIFGISMIRHSLRLNAELATRAWVMLGSLIVGVKIILRSVIHDFYAPFINLTKNSGIFFRITFFTYLGFSFQPLCIMAEIAGGESVAAEIKKIV